MARTSQNGLDCESIATKLTVGFFKVLGLAPFVVKKSTVSEISKNPKKSLKFFASRLGSIYNLLLITLQIRILFVSFPLAHDIDYPDKTELTTLIEDAESVFGNAALFVVWLTLGFRQKIIVKLLNCLSSFDDSTLFANDPSFDCGDVFLVFFVNTFTWTGLLVTEQLAYSALVITWFSVIVPSFVLAWFVTQYAFVVKFIAKRFRALNRELQEKFIFSSSTNNRRSFVGTNPTIDRTSASVIRTVRRAHTNLYEITLEVSDFYSLPILLAIAYANYAIIYNAYYLVVPFTIAIEEQTYLMYANSAFWVSSLVLPIVFLASGVTNVDKEIRNTAKVIRRLMSCSTTSRHEVLELKEFAMELLHRKLKFTACGLFPLDCRLVHSIFSMVANRLIILMQFQIPSYRRTSYYESRNITSAKLITLED